MGRLPQKAETHPRQINNENYQRATATVEPTTKSSLFEVPISDKAPKLECTVRNISETGASIQVSTTIGIPSIFDVIIDGARRQCRSVWRTDTKIGIAFQ